MHHSKLASKDYESFPKFGVKQNLVREYETIEAPYQVLEDPKQIVYENSMKANDVLSKNDQVYEDPGHKKEVIYSWFEKKKFRKIRKENIRYHGYIVLKYSIIISVDVYMTIYEYVASWLIL